MVTTVFKESKKAVHNREQTQFILKSQKAKSTQRKRVQGHTDYKAYTNRNFRKVIELFYTLMVVATWFLAFGKTHRTVHQKEQILLGVIFLNK